MRYFFSIDALTDKVQCHTARTVIVISNEIPMPRGS